MTRLARGAPPPPLTDQGADSTGTAGRSSLAGPSPSRLRGREEGGVDEAKALGRRVREVRSWRQLTLREAAGLAGLSFSFWGQVERGDKAVTNRTPG